MIKRIILIVIFTLTTGCGYEAIYSKKNRIKDIDFSINKINFEGNRELNIIIKRKLSNYSNKNNGKKYNLFVRSETIRSVVANDTKGDPSIFKITATIFARSADENSEINEMRFVESFKYNNNTDKFELKRYEREVNNNLAKTIIEDLISKLAGY